jgi:N6-adenosine-specific RNA methylase IME4
MSFLTQDFSDLAGKDYQIVLADPPWKYYGNPNKNQAAGKHYSMMSYEELKDLPIRSIMAKKSILFCWTTSSKMSETCSLIKDWGLHYRGVFQVWVKTNKKGKVINGQGIRPSFTKPTAEYLLVASTMREGRTYQLLTESMANIIMAKRPGNVHSRKPAEFRKNITDLLGDLKRVELFARESDDGWDAWGNEIPLLASSDDTNNALNK